MTGRYVTFNSVIRCNQIEATRGQDLGQDEYAAHSPENVDALRVAFGQGWPEGRMTWAFSWQALRDGRPHYRAIRKLIASYVSDYNDDVTFIPGGYFANAYNTREEVNKDLHEGLEMVAQMVGPGYRPRSVIAGFLAADNQRYLAEHEGIHVCQGNIWSQYAIDNQDGDGSICYPYYPSREHFCKPAQGPTDFIDCVNLDGWTCDFLAARREGFKDGFNSRMGVGPIETIGAHGPIRGLQQMFATTAAHLDTGVQLNGWGWVTTCWEVSLVPDNAVGNLDVLTRWLMAIRGRWPDAKCPTLADFGETWRMQTKDNRNTDLRFVQRGTGIGGSDANLEIRWFMNRDFRLALLHDWQQNTPEMVIDFTRYDLPAKEPQGLTRNWTLFGQINQKQTRHQDRPLSLFALPLGDQRRIFTRYPELARL